MVRYDQEARRGIYRHSLEQAAEAVDVGVVERRVDLVQHANGRRVRQEHREYER